MDLSGCQVMNICLIVEWLDIQMVFWIAGKIVCFLDHGLNNDITWQNGLLFKVLIWIQDNFVCYSDASWILDNSWASE